MTEAPDARDARARRDFSWSRSLTAGAIATIVITVTMMLTGTNIMKMLGSMLLPNAGTGAQYAVGGAIHLMIGLFYGVAYAWLVGRVSEWNRFVKGAVYGLAITGIALAFMPLMTAMMGGGGASNPCGGGASGAAATNPCQAGAGQSNMSGAASNPCAAKEAGAKNPCGAANPCKAAHAQSAANPCAAKNPSAANPCAAHGGNAASNACHAAASNPCGGAANPCSPSGGSQPPTSGLFSLLNHLVFGLTLAFAYGRGR